MNTMNELKSGDRAAFIHSSEARPITKHRRSLRIVGFRDDEILCGAATPGPSWCFLACIWDLELISRKEKVAWLRNS